MDQETGRERSNSTAVRVALGGLAVLGLTSASLAGVVDSPPPTLTLGGSPAKVAFIVPGVVRHANLRTEFMCTSLEATNPFKFAVEVFPSTGGPPVNNANAPTSNGTLTLKAGETRTVATGGTAGLHEDTVVEPVCVAGTNAGAFCDCVGGVCSGGLCASCPATGGCTNGTACTGTVDCTVGGGACTSTDIGNGSARIVSDSPKITCSAFITDKLGNPPSGMVSLKVIQKKQKGE